MKLRIHAAAVIALAITAAGTITAKAAAVTNYTDGDILLGVRATDSGQGNATVYLINLGNYSQFTNATAGSSFEVANLFSDLNTIYGQDDWYSRSGVQWGIFGGYKSSATVYTLYASRQSSTAWAQLNSIAVSNTYTAINQVRNSYNGGTPATGNSSDATTQNASLSNGYNNAVKGSTDFAVWSGGIEATLNNSLNLFALKTNTATAAVGSFSLSDQGVVTFTAVPEPSTVLLLGIAGLALVVFRRRLQKIQA